DPHGDSRPTATLTAPRRLAAVKRVRSFLPDLREAVAGAARLATRAAGAQRGMVTVVGADRVHLVDVEPPPPPGSPLEVHGPHVYCRRVIDGRATVVVGDVAADHLNGGDPSGGFGAYVGAPVVVGDVPVGVLAVADAAARDWTAEQVRAVEDAAKLVAGTITAVVPGPAVPDPPPPRPVSPAPAPRPGQAVPSAAEELLAALLDSMHGSVLVIGPDGRATSNAAMRTLGLPADWQLADLADLLPYLFHPDGRPMALNETPLMRATAGETVREAEIVVRAPEGEGVLLVNGRPVTAADGRRLGALVVTQDITEVRRLALFHECELGVTRILARSGRTADVAADVLRCVGGALGARRGELWLLDPVGGHHRRAAGWTAGDEPGGPDASPATVLAMMPGAAGRAEAVSVPLVRDGDTFGSLVFHGCVRGRAGDIDVFLQGIAAQLAQYVERRRAEELALELARTKDEFIALAGHTLRTPLTTIVSLTELLLSAGDDLADERAELLGRVCANAVSLRGIVHDLLDLAGLESGHINLNPAPLDLAELVGDAVAELLPAADAAGVRVVTELPDELPSVGDRVRLRQAVDNLLSNAVKYSPGGGGVRVRLADVDSVAELSVADEGLGIPMGEREKLFSRFFRGATAHERGIPGTGLGLPLTRLIVELHGGTIALTDDEGPGSTFIIRLPLVPPPGD
ncbi:MAG TPA: ATP-binding protein, partial [Micromonosporaceae bacterium]|nr:ATP-binding protein [Micromonosporaceae bacterium]